MPKLKVLFARPSRCLATLLLAMLGSVALLAAPHRVVRVGVFPHAPAIFMGEDGKAKGFFVDMLGEVAAREDWELQFVPGTWQQGLDRARSGELDLITSVAYTPERGTYLDFGREASYTVWSILYAHPKAAIRTVLDVLNRRIGLMRGDVNGQHFKDLCLQFNLPVTYEEFGSFVDVLKAVEAGKVDGGVTSSLFGYSEESRYQVERTPVVFSPFALFFAVPKGRNQDLVKALDAYLQVGKSNTNSGYQRALDRWLTPRQGHRLPAWFLWTGLGILGALVLAILVALAFRRQVALDTAEIRTLNAGLERELADRRRLEAQILHVVSGVSASHGASFLQELVKHLAGATDATGALIGEVVHGQDAKRIRTLAVYLDGALADNREYLLAGSPCEQALKGEFCVFAHGVQAQFPTMTILGDLQAESYVGAPLMDAQGKVLGVLAVIHRTPLTSPSEVVSLLRIFSARAAAELDRRNSEGDRQLLERQMHHSQKLESLGVLAGGIAHDFNNLLTAMLGHLNVAQMKLAPESPAQPHLESLERIIHRAADLTRQMLAYSGRGHFVVRPLDLSQAVLEVTHLLEVSISKKIALRFNLAQDLPFVKADAAQIQQVVMNLVTNAADAIGDREGTIRLTTSSLQLDRTYLDQVFEGQDLPPGSYVVLEVGDTGCGMARDVLDRIFEPFFTTKVTGRGLGLSATMGILKGHGAGMRIYSEPGLGTTFKLLFPADEGHQEDLPAQTTAPALMRPATVLLVDDEEMIREAAASVLEAIGLTVITAADGLEAVEAVQRADLHIDLVLMDLTMPRMDGQEAFQVIHRLRPQLPVILSSGYNKQESIQAFLGRGLAAFIQKPYTLRALEQTVLEVLAKTSS